jgi:hypothetical protein
MSRRTVADVADAGAWVALAPDATPSTAIAVELVAAGHDGEPAIAIAAQAGSEGHMVQRTLPAAVDLTAYDDLELWVRADRVADGSAARPLYLELTLGSEQLAAGAAGNTWLRMLAIGAPDAWQPVALALDDLPAGVRGALTELRLTCTDASTPFQLQLGEIAATRAELLLDVDSALARRVTRGLQLDGSAVAAVVDPGAAPAAPYLRIRNYAVRPAEERSPGGDGVRSDHTRRGFSLRAASVAVDLFYAIDAVADDRAHAAAMFQHAFAELAPRTTLDVDGRPLAVEWVEGPPLEFDDISDRPALHVRVATIQRPRARRTPVVPPYNNVAVEVDGRAVVA